MFQISGKFPQNCDLYFGQKVYMNSHPDQKVMLSRTVTLIFLLYITNFRRNALLRYVDRISINKATILLHFFTLGRNEKTSHKKF